MRLYDLVRQFRNAIVVAQEKGYFDNDNCFRYFPKQCCGDTCCLLAEYLKSEGIETIYVWGDCNFETHAWLVLSDADVNTPEMECYEAPKEMLSLIKHYGGCIGDDPVDVSRYREEDVCSGTIIDITADQFGREPIYIDKTNEFYQKFEFRSACVHEGLYNKRLRCLYEVILEQI